MGIQVVVTGVLHKDAVSRISQNGNPYVTCNVRVEQDGQTLWVNVISFNEEVQAELLQMRGGEAVSIQGKAAPKVYFKDDEARPSLHVTAYAVQSLEPAETDREAAPPKQPAYAASPPLAPATPKPRRAPRKSPAPRTDERYADDGFDDPLDF
jgi:single-stranded DNA-binding protein